MFIGNMKKWFGVSIVCCLLLAVGLTSSALADYAVIDNIGEALGYGPNGKFLAAIGAPDTQAIPIYTAQDLYDVRNDLSGSYVLMNDLDLQDFNNGQWTPIADNYRTDARFSGIFDGQGHVIKNLLISTNPQYAGLFGYAQNAVIKNVGLEDLNISGSSANVGGLVGYSAGTVTIFNCYSSGDVSSASSTVYIGGLVGYVNGSVTLTSCYNSGSVSSANSYSRTGGLIGYLNLTSDAVSSTIENSFNSGKVSAVNTGSGTIYVGGIIGYADGAVLLSDCSNRGAITASGANSSVYAGGFISYAYRSLSIFDCYNSGDVFAANNSTAYSGGIIGDISSSGSNFIRQIDQCYNLGRITASSTNYAYAGGLCGTGRSSVSNSYNTGNIDSSAASATSRAYAGGICGYNYSPVVACHNSGVVYSSALSESYMGGICGYNTSSVADSYNSGYISDINAPAAANSYMGGICGYSSGFVSSSFNNVAVSSYSSRTTRVGGICGLGASVSSCCNSGDITAFTSSTSAMAGGICGSGTNISYSYNTGFVSAIADGSSSASISAGGICGSGPGGGSISKCYNTGSISATITTTTTSSVINNSRAGGISGYGVGAGTISDCYNTGTVYSSATAATTSAYSYAGGICGIAYYSMSGYTVRINNCYDNGDIHSYTNTPSGARTRAGGICGMGYGSDSGFGYNSIIANCVVLSHRIWAENNLNSNIYSYVVGYGASKQNNLGIPDILGNPQADVSNNISSAQAQSSSTYTGLGWDFTNTWQMIPGYLYPQLRSMPVLEQNQTANFSGVILYQTPGRAAKVELFDNKGDQIATTATDEDGAYTLSAPPGTGYTLVITKPAYLSYTIKNLTLTEGEAIETVDFHQLGGDINRDGYVNSEDLVCLISEFGKAPVNYELADIDGDGLVNSVDLTILLAGFNRWNVEIDKHE